VGTRADVVVLLPADSRVGSLEVNGRAIKPFAQKGTVLTATIRFAGTPFEHCQQIGSYDRSFAGKLFRSQFTVPEHVFTQLADRKKAWPVPYDEDDRRATWLAPERLLLFVQIADADDKMAVAMTIDGKPVEIKPAYGAIYPDARERTFLGFYADVSRLTPDTQHEVELTLPALRPGQFQGLFFENVEAELTAEPFAAQPAVCHCLPAGKQCRSGAQCDANVVSAFAPIGASPL
jgi:hypothetical protein